MTQQSSTVPNAGAQPPSRPQPEPKPKYDYGPNDRKILFFALLVGIVANVFLYYIASGSTARFITRYSLFWLCYLVIFYAACWQGVRANKSGWALAASAGLIMLSRVVFDSESMAIFCTLILPMLLMMHAQVCLYGDAPGADGRFFVAFLEGWFVRPFTAIGHFFGSIGSLFKGRKDSPGRKIAIGLVIAVPLAVVIFALLASSDIAFQYYADKLFDGLSLGDIIGRGVMLFLFSMLFFSFFWNGAMGKREVKYTPSSAHWDVSVLHIVIGALLLVYALFCAVQFSVLFAGRLPAQFTYSEYARSGFFQLIVVTAINLILFGLASRFSDKTRLRWMLGGLLLFTGLMLFSGFVRLFMYIGMYQLTLARILPLWFMAFISFVVIICAVGLFVRLPLLRISAGILVSWYLVLCFASPDAIIARYNLGLQSAEFTQGCDEKLYLMQLSGDAVPALLEYTLGSGDLEMANHLQTRLKRLMDGKCWNLSQIRAANAIARQLTFGRADEARY